MRLQVEEASKGNPDQPLTCPYKGLPDIDCLFQNDCRHQLRAPLLGTQKVNFSTVLAAQAVRVKEVIWLVSFMDYDLGYFDLKLRVLEP